MAASIIKETGAGVDGANCYFEIAQLRTYYEGHQFSAAIDALTDAELIPASITACRDVDSSSDISGIPVDLEQDMAWPRLGARMRVDPSAAAFRASQVITGSENAIVNEAGAIASDIVPKGYVKACMEMVRFTVGRDRSAAFDKPAVKREKIDVIEREYTDAGSAQDLIPEIVQRMVRPYTIAQADQGAPVGAGGVGVATAVRILRS